MRERLRSESARTEPLHSSPRVITAYIEMAVQHLALFAMLDDDKSIETSAAASQLEVFLIRSEYVEDSQREVRRARQVGAGGLSQRTAKTATFSVYSRFDTGTTSTGHAAPRRILSVTLPISMRDSPLRPWDDMTTRSICSFSAQSTIAL